MDREKLKRLYREIERISKETGQGEALCTALRTYLDKTERYYQVKDGFLPPITAGEKEEILREYDKLAEALDGFIHEEGKYDPGLVKKVNEFAELASWHFNILYRYEPKKGLKSAATLAEENRTPRLKVTGELNTVSGMINKRDVVGFRDDSGNEQRGVFTELRRTGYPTAHVNGGLKKLAKTISDPLLSKFIEDILSLSEEKLDQLFQETGESLRTKDFISKNSAAVYYLLRFACPRGAEIERHFVYVNHVDGHWTKTYAPRTADSVVDALAKLSFGKYTAQELKEKIGTENLKEFAALLDKQKDLPPHDSESLSEGTRTEANGIAVSVLADFFGVSDVVARTVPAILVQDGKERKGSLMYEAKGLIKGAAPDEAFKEIDIDCLNDLQESHGSAEKAIVEMGWLDFISFNIDRTENNMAYRFGKGNKLVHVEGFDHDRTFPTEMPKIGDFASENYSIPENMRFISVSMAKRIVETDPKRLRFALWCSGIDKNQRDVAVKLFELAKKHILESRKHYQKFDAGRSEKERKENPYQLDQTYIREIPDDDFHKVVFYSEDYRPKGLYRTLADILAPRWLEPVKKQGLNLQKEQEKHRLPIKAEDIIGANSRATYSGLKASQKELVGLEKWLKRKTWFGISSDNYRAMQSALEKLHFYQEELLKRMGNPNAGLQESVTPGELFEIQRLNEELEKCVWNYLYGKFGTKDEPDLSKKRKPIWAYLKGKQRKFKSDYEKERVDAALEVLLFSRKGQNIGAEMNTAVFNTRQAEERRHYQKSKKI